MIYYTPQFIYKTYQKASTDCRKVLDAVCTHVTSSAASPYSAVNLRTDSYQFWVVTFQSHIRFARKVQNMAMHFQKPIVVTCVTLAKAVLVVGSSFSNTLRVPSLCNL